MHGTQAQVAQQLISCQQKLKQAGEAAVALKKSVASLALDRDAALVAKASPAARLRRIWRRSGGHQDEMCAFFGGIVFLSWDGIGMGQEDLGSQLCSCKKRLEEAEDEQFRVRNLPTPCCRRNSKEMK